MSTPYLGEVRMFGFRRTPIGWVPCDGRLLAIAENDALYVLLGTTYGGDGMTTFAVPDLRGRLPLHQGQSSAGSNYVLGQASGTESVTLITPQMPTHAHPVFATTATANSGTVRNSLMPGTVSGETAYATDTTGGIPAMLAPTTVSVSGGNLPHENCMATLTVQFCIATEGVFPPQN